MKQSSLKQRMASLLIAAGFASFGLIITGGFSSPLLAASCCGGGGGGALILPKFQNYMVDFSLSQETSHGFWDGSGTVRPDPIDSSLQQSRIGYGAAMRLNPNWQSSITSAYVMNDNSYSGKGSKTNGFGDTTIAFTYENFDRITCVNELKELADWLPSSYFGIALTLPTGASPYNDVSNDSDITGRGFYRLDLNVTVEKTVYPWSVGLSGGYGRHLARKVNKDKGVYVLPYTKQLGDRRNAGMNIGYTWFTDNLDQVVFTYSYTHLAEGQTKTNGVADSSTGMMKRGQKFQFSYQTMDQAWIVKFSYSEALAGNALGRSFPMDQVRGGNLPNPANIGAYRDNEYDQGRSFPITKTISIGVSHVFNEL